MSWINHITREDFNRARRRALVAQLGALLNRSSNELLPLEEVRARLNIRGQRHLGNRAVALSQIVGSEGRYADFDRQFAPLHEATKYRWMSIDRAHHEAVALPAVELYKLGDIYFVKDGHHRISVARLQGQIDIDAVVNTGSMTLDVGARGEFLDYTPPGAELSIFASRLNCDAPSCRVRLATHPVVPVGKSAFTVKQFSVALDSEPLASLKGASVYVTGTIVFDGDHRTLEARIAPGVSHSPKKIVHLK